MKSTGFKSHTGAALPCALVALLLLVGTSSPVHGAELNITETAKLDFGAVVDRNGSVTVGLSDNVLSDPAGIHVGGVVNSGRFRITGDAFAAFSLLITSADSGGLSLDAFNTSRGTPPLLSVAIPLSGFIDLAVGARLTVDAAAATPGFDQPLSFTIIIDYN